MDIKIFFGAFFAFLALVNPIQKLFVVFSLQSSYDAAQLRRIVIRASITALAILVLFLFMGDMILRYLFNLQIYAFQITCGLVLFFNGFMGLQKGVFLSLDKTTRIEDIIAVPIAVPMIAGPATITAAVTMPSIYGNTTAVAAVVLAVVVNLVLMLNASRMASFLVAKNIMMPLIRITGLIVAAIGVQMVLNGMATFVCDSF